MNDNDTCQRCICPKCIWQQTDECIEGEDYCEDVCESDYPTEICPHFEFEEE